MTIFPGAGCCPGAGDELQGIKKGLVELADMIAVNKGRRRHVKRAQPRRSRNIAARCISSRPVRKHGIRRPHLFGVDGDRLEALCRRFSDHRTAMMPPGEFAERRGSSR